MYWGIDLGGTKVEGVVCDQQGNALIRKRIPAESHLGYQHILQQIRLLILAMEKEIELKATIIGMGIPGSIDPHTGLLKNSNSTFLNGKPFLSDAQKILNRPVIITNDANCLALAETRMGIVRDVAPHAKNVFGVIMGSGVGGGIVINNQIIDGAMGIAGEWGHNFLDASGGPCYCGQVGCVETILSGPALERFYDPKRQTKLPAIYQEYKSGNNQRAKETIERLLHFFGIGLSVVINILDPDVIVLGGGVGNIDELYSIGLKNVEASAFNTYFNSKILRPKWGDSAGVFGAAFLTEKYLPHPSSTKPPLPTPQK